MPEPAMQHGSASFEPYPVYVVDVDEDEAVRLRERPEAAAPEITMLLAGQLVARLDHDDRGDWWHVFADTPGEGAFVGYINARFLRKWTQPSVASAPVFPSEGGS